MKVFSIILAVTAATASVTTTSVQTDRYATLLTSQSGSILTVTLNNNASIVNLIDDQVLVDLDRLVTSLQNNNATKVVLFQSLNPNFFAAHYDITPLIQGPGKRHNSSG
jgi:enoyl-CoA hydratase/carnithine racemase